MATSLQQLVELGQSPWEARIDYDDIVSVLEADGMRRFPGSFTALLHRIAAGRDQLATA